MTGDGYKGCAQIALFVLVMAACHPIAGESSIDTPGIGSLLITVGDQTGFINSYRATLRSETRHESSADQNPPAILEFNYDWKRTEGQFGYDAHAVTTVVDWQSGVPGVMDERYAVGDFVYSTVWNGWSVVERSQALDLQNASLVSSDGTLPDMDAVAQLDGMPLQALVAQSDSRGLDEIGGVSVTRYQLDDVQTLKEIVRARLGVAPGTPLEVESAQFDIWLAEQGQFPLKYTFRSEGSVATSAGSNALVPCVVEVRYGISEVNSDLPVEIAEEALAAAQTQLDALRNR